MPCRPTKLSKNTKLCANQSGRSSPPPEGLRGVWGAAPLNRGSRPKSDTQNCLGEQSTNGKRAKPSTKERAIRRKFDGYTKSRHTQFFWSVTNCPRYSSRTAIASSAVVAQSRGKERQTIFYTLLGGGIVFYARVCSPNSSSAFAHQKSDTRFFNIQTVPLLKTSGRFFTKKRTTKMFRTSGEIL